MNDFLNAYENVRYTAENRYHLIHVVALPVNRKEAQSYANGILNHPTVQGYEIGNFKDSPLIRISLDISHFFMVQTSRIF